MPTSRKILSAFLTTLALAGCASGRYTPYEGLGTGRAASAQRVVRPPGAEPSRLGAPVSLAADGARRDYRVYRLSTPSQGENGQPGRLVTGRYYEAPGRARRPLVVLLPIWGASTYPQRITLRHLLRGPTAARVDVLALDGEDYLFRWRQLIGARSAEAFLGHVTDSRRAFEVTVADVRRLLRWGAGRARVDADRVALVGYSLSAIMAVSVVALEPGVHTGVFVMGGARLAEVMAICPRRPARARRNMLSLTGWSTDRYRTEIESLVAPIDPLPYAPAIHPSKVLYIDAEGDACIPPGGREDLWSALGRPARLTLPQNHRNAFLTMTPLGHWTTTRRIVEFLETRLLAPPRPRPGAVTGELD